MAFAKQARVRPSIWVWIGALAVLTAAAPSRGLAGSQDLNLALVPGDQVLVDGLTAVFPVFEPWQGRDLNGDGFIASNIVHVFDARRGTTWNLGLVSFSLLVKDGIVAVLAEEGPDLNGDGDLDDFVLHVFDTRTGRLRNLGLAALELPSSRILDGRFLPFAVRERNQGGTDLNGDGDADDVVVHYLDLRTGEVVNTHLAPFSGIESAHPVLAGRFMVLTVSEFDQGETDLNGDGDAFDEVVHVFDTRLRTARNLGLAVSLGATSDAQVSGRTLVFSVSEPAQQVDLNGNGGAVNQVPHLVDLPSGRVTNLGLAASDPVVVDADAGLAVFPVSEPEQGNQDLTGDGRADDFPVHAVDLRTGSVRNLRLSARSVALAPRGRAVLGVMEGGERDLNRDGDAEDVVLQVVDLLRRLTFNTRLAFQDALIEPRFVREFFPFLVSEEQQGRDLNGDGDALDAVLHVTSLRTGATQSSGLDGTAFGLPVFAGRNGVRGARIVVPVSERNQGGRDLDGDGDADDVVLHIFDARRRTARNLRLPVRFSPGDPFDLPDTASVFGGKGFVSVAVPETDASADLNGDGDVLDNVLHLVDIESGAIANVGRAVNGEITFVGVPFFSGFGSPGTLRVDSPREGGAYAFLVSEKDDGNVDLNGDGDTEDHVVHATRLVDRDRDGRFDFADDRIGR